MRIEIKPLSVNAAWQGRRVKSSLYRSFEKQVLYSLKPYIIPDGKLKITFTFGFSNRGSDWDNPIKPFQDCLSKKYGFNDNRIYCGITFKKIVPKGYEFIEFKIEKYETV